MNYKQIAEKIRTIVKSIKRRADSASDYHDESSWHYAQGLSDAIEYFDDILIELDKLAEDEQYENLKNRKIEVSNNQKSLFD